MALTRKAEVDPLIAELWATDLYSQAEKLTFWAKFEGPEGSGMPVIRKDDFEKQPSDLIRFDIVMALTGVGQMGGDTELLEGNEEEVKFRQITMGLASLKHAVRWSWESELMITHNMRVTALNQLRKWLAGKLDDRIFAEFTGMTIGGYVPGLTAANLPTSMKWYSAAATSIATITESTDNISLNDISEIKAYAMQQNMLEPLRLSDGEEVYGLVLHPYTALDLKQNTSGAPIGWVDLQKNVRERGAGNPLFSGALGMWDNVILYVSPRVPTAADGDSNAVVARNIFLGGQAMLRGWALHPQWIEQEFSYGEEIGIATRMVLGQRLVTFDLNAVETTGDKTDDTAIGAMILYAPAGTPTA